MTLPLIKATPTHAEAKCQDESGLSMVTEVEPLKETSKKEGFPYNIEFEQVSNLLDSYVPV